MRHFVIILFLIPIVLHAQVSKRKSNSTFQPGIFSDKKLQIDIFGFHGPKLLDTLYYDKKQIKAIGYYAVDKHGHKTFYRVGLWTEYYRTGLIMSIGNYDLQFYYGCYTTMPGVQYYSFKKGGWSYFYENGQTKEKGIYQVVRVPISTGIANQFESKSSITGDWLLNDEGGQPAKDRQIIISDIDKPHL